MRTTSERKAETRERILTAAGTLFRVHGIDGVGIDAIMREAGLTHGGFYAHFASKEALVAEVSAASLARSAARWERLSQELPPSEALERIVDAYLDRAHIATPERGCVLTTLGPEVARREEARRALTASVSRMLEALTRCSDGRRERAAETLACMVGAVVLARLVDDPLLAEEMLDAARHAAGL